MKKPLEHLIRRVESEFCLSRGSLAEHHRQRDIAEARHAYWLVAAFAGHSFGLVAESINRDRTSGYNAITKAVQLSVHDREYRSKINGLINQIKDEEKAERIPTRVALYRCAITAIM